MKKWRVIALLLAVLLLTGCSRKEKAGSFFDGQIIYVTAENFDQVVMNSDKPVLLDFWASWCGPCQMIAPYLEEIAAERPDVLVCKINVDEEPELASQFQVMSIPTLMVVKNGEVVSKTMGARPKAQINAML